VSTAWDSKAKLNWDFSHGHLPIGQLILNQLLNVLVKALKMERLTSAIPKAR
jgi:hypothetical protein